MRRMIRAIPLLFLVINRMQKIFSTALIAGLIAGLFVFGVQSAKLTPLILEAETYEEADANRQENAEAAMNAAMPGMDHHMDHSHHHEEAAWEPANGFERNAWRLAADLGMGVGFALMLVGAFSLRREPMSMQRGVLWGLAGFAVFSLAPGFGLPPELPATMAADLMARQTWWVGTALATAAALYLLVYGQKNTAKMLGIAILMLPHVIGAPKPPLGGVVPTELNAAFAAASLATMAMFWVVLGAASGWLYGRKSFSAQVA